jgi:hypothetical protein
MRFLICPGMARSGTTFLWQQLSGNKDIFNISKDQELRYLGKERVTFKGYMTRFHTTDPSKIFLDVSPIYLFKSPTVVENMKNILRGHEVRFILHVRSPMEHAYSLYLHQIRETISRHGHMRPGLVGKGRFEAGSVNQYIFDRPSYFLKRPLRIVEFVEGVIRNFGRESLAFVDFNREFGTDAPASKLEKLLNVRLKPFDYSQTTNRGGNQLPAYIYGGENGITFEAGDLVYSVEPRTMILVAGRNSTKSWPNVEPQLAAQIFNGAGLWTTYVPKQRVQELFERHFEKPWQRLSSLLDYDFLASVQHKDLVTYKTMPLTYVKNVAGIRIEDDL